MMSVVATDQGCNNPWWMMMDDGSINPLKDPKWKHRHQHYHLKITPLFWNYPETSVSLPSSTFEQGNQQEKKKQKKQKKQKKKKKKKKKKQKKKKRCWWTDEQTNRMFSLSCPLTCCCRHGNTLARISASQTHLLVLVVLLPATLSDRMSTFNLWVEGKSASR